MRDITKNIKRIGQRMGLAECKGPHAARTQEFLLIGITRCTGNTPRPRRHQGPTEVIAAITVPETKKMLFDRLLLIHRH